MRVGLFDGDLRADLLSGLNLDLMKMSSYLKMSNHIPELIYSEDRLEQAFSKFYCFKEFSTKKIPEIVSSLPNIDYIGSAFSKYGYSKIIKDLDDYPADLTIYDKWYDEFGKRGGRAKRRYAKLLNSDHLKISLDGKQLKDKIKIKQGAKGAIIYDKYITNIPDWDVALKEINGYFPTRKKPISIAAKHPIKVDTIDKINKIQNISFAEHFVKFYAPAEIPDEVFLNIFYNKGFTFASNFKYYGFVDAQSWEDQKIIFEIEKIVKRIIFSQSHYHFFPLIYTRGKLKEPYETSITAIATWSTSSKYYESFAKYINSKSIISRNKIKEQLNILVGMCPSLKEYFLMEPQNLNLPEEFLLNG